MLAGGMHKTHTGSEMQQTDWLESERVERDIASCQHGSGHSVEGVSGSRSAEPHHLRWQNLAVVVVADAASLTSSVGGDESCNIQVAVGWRVVGS